MWQILCIYLSNYTELLGERISLNYVCSSVRKTNLIRTYSDQEEKDRRRKKTRVYSVPENRSKNYLAFFFTINKYRIDRRMWVSASQKKNLLSQCPFPVTKWLPDR
jgi:hypothetical protein